MYCLKCGAKGKLYSNLCEDCFRKEREFARIPNHLTRMVCTECGDYRTGSTHWVNKFDGMQSLIESNLEFDPIVTDPLIDYPEFPDESNEQTIELNIIIFIDDIEIEVPLNFRLRTKYHVCDICSRKRGGYFEAIIQIRGDDRPVTPKEQEGVLAYLLKKIEEHSSDRMAFITKETVVKGGTDYHMGSTKFSKAVVRELQHRFGGKITETASIFGQKDGKDVYRHTLLLRLAKLRKGDVVSDGKHMYLVSSISKRFAYLKDLTTWRKIKVRYEHFKKYRVKADAKLHEQAVIIHSTEKEIQILHPETMKAVSIRLPDEFVRDGEETAVVSVDDELFLV